MLSQRSHLTAFASPVNLITDPNWQTIVQDQQPTHFSLLNVTIPVSSSFTIPPAMQASAQAGSAQCRHWRGIVMIPPISRFSSSGIT